MNAQELIQAIRDYTNRPDLTESTIALWWRAVEGDCNRLLKHPRMLVRADMTLSVDSKQVACPSDLLQMRNLFVGDVPVQQYQASNFQNATGQGYVVRGDVIWFNKLLPAGTVINLDYYAAIPPLSGQSPINWLSNLFPDAYIYGSLKQAAVYLKDNESMDKWNALYAQVMEGIDAQGWGSEISDAPRVRVSG